MVVLERDPLREQPGRVPVRSAVSISDAETIQTIGRIAMAQPSSSRP
jgi:hypothetical protein